MADRESECQGRPHYIGTGPVDRVEKLVAAADAFDWGRVRTNPAEPPGIMGLPGADGYYHDLLLDDLRDVVQKARRAEAAEA